MQSSVVVLFWCFISTRVPICTCQETQVSQSCSEVCGNLQDRVAALEAKWDKLAGLFSDGECSETEPNPEPVSEYQCYKGMTSPTTPPRVPVKILAGGSEALCDTETDGGGWIVIQRRVDGVEDFYRDWETYKSGFGTVNTDYWLGNDAIHSLTSNGTHELRIDLKFNGTLYYARYASFLVQDESSGYQMTLGSYTGNSGDSFTYHNNMKFSTYDRDNDVASQDCAELNHGGWWFRACNYCNLNAKWGPDADAVGGYLVGIHWNFDLTPQNGPYPSFTEMKIRRV